MIQHILKFRLSALSLAFITILAIAWQAGAAASPAPAGTILLRLPAGANTTALHLQPIHDLDYGSYRWLELTPADYARLAAANLPHQISDGLTLRLGETTIHTDQPPTTTQPHPNTPDLHLIQFIAPTRATWLAGLRAAGLEVVQYIHPFTYVVWGTAGQVADAARSDHVRWSAPFAPDYRVLPAYRNLPNQPIDVNVLLYRGANTAAVQQQIAALGIPGRGSHILNHTWEIAAYTLTGPQIQTVAQIPGVYSIQPVATSGGLRGEMSDQINVNNHDNSNLAFPGYPNWLSSVGLSGSGVIIANVDSGADNNHPDLVNRFIPCTGATCGGAASSSHGTHTSGIMAADGSSGIVDGNGFLRGLGMAPGANLVEQVYSPTYTQPGGMLRLMTDSYNNGAALSGNSWGPSGFPLGYDDDTLQVDIGVRDADPNAAGNQPLSYVLSFMNGYGGTSSQGTPDEAKNIFTIGSTKMQTSGGSQILDINDLSANSAHGPALDGRTIPHLVAPGCYVDSTYPSASYGTACGTSMASPHVSGAVALFIEYYRNQFAVDPSPALIKAAFLPVAHDLAGHRDADGNLMGHPFDSKQGWGRMDTAAVVDPAGPVLYFDNPTIFGNSGESWTQSVRPANPDRPMRLMLVWTDAPGHGLGGSTPAWNNDLDLLVTLNSTTYLGNVFGSDGWSQTGGTADGRNNTEGVFLPNVPNTTLTLQVVAANISSDGIPNQGDDTDQDFALVCYNCALGDPEPVLTAYKTASAANVTPGRVFTYTLASQVTLTGSHTAQTTLADMLPATVTILTSTLRLNGQPAPELYDPINHAINATINTPFTNTQWVTITFQVRVNEGVLSGTLISNSVAITSSVDGGPPLGPITATADVQVSEAAFWPVYLPWLRKAQP